MKDKIKGIYFEGYKSFPNEKITEIPKLEKINVLIGQNNCGKSSVLDILSMIIEYDYFKQNFDKVGEVGFDIILKDEDIRFGFNSTYSGGGIPGINHYEYGREFIDQSLRCTMTRGVLQDRETRKSISKLKYKIIDKDSNFVNSEIYDATKENWTKIVNAFDSTFVNYKFRRLNADRNISPEIESGVLYLNENGEGATSLISIFLNNKDFDEKLIEIQLLQELNKIMNPDSNFTNIKIQYDSATGYKEIYLEENGMKRFPLSQSGSGLKTVILILLNILIIPELDEYKDKEIVFAFEEIENNLHPALQKRLFNYLYEYAIERNKCIFLTTHSHVAINIFSGKKETQIIHVTKNEKGESELEIIEDYFSKIQILEDLDVRASDLLQSNGIIWVEGPSDKIYIKKWLEVFCNSEYEEGLNYQFLYYGGRLLSHYEAQPEENENDLINVLLTNRNSAIVMDSDKRDEEDKINSTKSRVKDEFDQNGSFCWITKGKEIENYLSKDALNDALRIEMEKQCAQYELFSEYMKENGKFKDKVPFARSVTPEITKENSEKILDLKNQIEKLYLEIKKWNE